MRFMCVTPRSASINKRFKLSWYICPIRRRDRYNNISPFILLNYPINIVILNTFCCIMTSSTSFAKFYIIIINTYIFNIMFLFQTSSNYINNFCCCSISYRTTIHYQYFHFDLRFHVPYFYMISQNHYIINNNRNILRLFPCLQYIIQVRKVNHGYAEESLFHSA